MKIDPWLLLLLAMVFASFAGCISPQSANLLEEAKALQQKGDLNQSLVKYDEAISLDANNSAAWAGRGEVLHLLGRDEDAVHSLTKSTVLEPASAQVWIALGDTLADMGKNDEAFSAYDNAIKLNSNATMAWYGIGNVWAREGRYKDSAAAYSMALRTNESYARQQRTLAMCSLR